MEINSLFGIPAHKDALGSSALDDEGLSAGLATRGRALVEAEHDARRHMDRLAATYRSLLA